MRRGSLTRTKEKRGNDRDGEEGELEDEVSSRNIDHNLKLQILFERLAFVYIASSWQIIIILIIIKG